MAIAGIHRAVVNPLGANEQSSSSIVPLDSQDVASVTPVQDIRKGEEQNTELRNQENKENQGYKLVNTRFEFSVHEGTKEIMVKVINEDTNEVIREIPPEQILDMVAKMWELAGILVDKSV